VKSTHLFQIAAQLVQGWEYGTIKQQIMPNFYRIPEYKRPTGKCIPCTFCCKFALKVSSNLTCVTKKYPGLHCCSKWFEPLSRRIANCLTNCGYSSRSLLVHCLWVEDNRSESWHRDNHQLFSIIWRISLRHCSKSRHISWITLFGWSLRDRFM